MKNFVFFALFFVSLSSYSNDSNYVFGWTQLKDAELKKPRGGTTVGEKVTLDKEPNDLWGKLQNSELTKFEKDRLAILSMEGRYRVYFDFMKSFLNYWKYYKGCSNNLLSVYKQYNYFKTTSKCGHNNLHLTKFPH